MKESNSKSRILSDWLSYLGQLHSSAIELGLERVRRVAIDLGLAPDFPIITVGGTNGKGSTCAMMESILAQAGYRVGCYSSPHLLRYNERVRISRREASDDDLCRAFDIVESARDRSGISLTYFEFGTLGAMQLFIEAGVDIAILEVGLGGRLDAVNIFDADCSVVTSIDLDHIEYLGDTREKIGFEKAGIFRSGRPAICSEPQLPTSVRRHANEIGANLLHIGQHFGHSVNAADAISWDYWGPGQKFYSLPHPALRGAWQLHNASACLAALDALHERLPVTIGDVRLGLLNVALPGRFQVLPGRPVAVLDVAHNPGAAGALATNLGGMGGTGKSYAVFAMLRDKDIAGVVRMLAPHIDLWLTAGIDMPRGASADELMHALVAVGVDALTVEAFPNPAAAYSYACEQAVENDRICVFGSFHTVADVLRYRDLAGHA